MKEEKKKRNNPPDVLPVKTYCPNCDACREFRMTLREKLMKAPIHSFCVTCQKITDFKQGDE